jgi:hypothetical protein
MLPDIFAIIKKIQVTCFDKNFIAFVPFLTLWSALT